VGVGIQERERLAFEELSVCCHTFLQMRACSKGLTMARVWGVAGRQHPGWRFLMLHCSSPRPEWSRHKTAQGNALGDYVNKKALSPLTGETSRPSRISQDYGERSSVPRGSPIVPPLQGLKMVQIQEPGAMPWADLLCPFRAPTKMRKIKTGDSGWCGGAAVDR
jgi:hypothetical protein